MSVSVEVESGEALGDRGRLERERAMLEWIEVGDSPIHGRGVFAKKDLRAGQRIGLFEGESTLEDGTYVLWIFDENGEEVGIEGRNALRFLNHGEPPNAEFQEAELFVTRAIPIGGEVLIDYGPDE